MARVQQASGWARRKRVARLVEQVATCQKKCKFTAEGKSARGEAASHTDQTQHIVVVRSTIITAYGSPYASEEELNKAIDSAEAAS